MKIFSPEQTKRLDMETIQELEISSLDLMEKASNAFVDSFLKRHPTPTNVYVFCGSGNNGGDGLAIARKLIELNFEVSVFIVAFKNRTPSPDFKLELELLDKIHPIKYIEKEEDIPSLSNNGIVIDAIFGSGLNKPLDKLTTLVTETINSSGSKIFSVDIASGLFSDSCSKNCITIQPTFTFSFQFPKLAFLLPENVLATGEFEILDIGLSKHSIEKEKSELIYLQKENIKLLLKKRSKYSHKGNFGHVLLYAGKIGSMGAALLSAKAALRTGCGLVTVFCPSSQTPIVQTAIWEAMCLEYSLNDSKPIIENLQKFTLGIGPGIGQELHAQSLLNFLLSNSKKPLVIDADGLNILSNKKELLNLLPQNSILTPHPKEFERLVGSWNNDFERLEKQKDFSTKHHLYIVLKGANSSISTPEGLVYFNSTGNAGMATAGSGDVLTGIIVSLLAQNYTPEQASVIGTFIHGYAGDLAAKKYGQNSLIASDIIEHLPSAFKELQEA